MVELAEYLVDLITGMDWAFFAKNGGDTTHYAVMIARDATNRKKIIMIKGGYHGVAPWMQAPGHHGLMETDWREYHPDSLERYRRTGARGGGTIPTISRDLSPRPIISRLLRTTCCRPTATGGPWSPSAGKNGIVLISMISATAFA